MQRLSALITVAATSSLSQGHRASLMLLPPLRGSACGEPGAADCPVRIAPASASMNSEQPHDGARSEAVWALRFNWLNMAKGRVASPRQEAEFRRELAVLDTLIENNRIRTARSNRLLLPRFALLLLSAPLIPWPLVLIWCPRSRERDPCPF